MSPHIDTSDPKYKAAAAEILRRHDNGEPEANITTAVRNFLTITGLVKDEELVSTKRDWGDLRDRVARKVRHVDCDERCACLAV